MTVETNRNDERIAADYASWLSEVVEEPVAPEENFLDVGGNSMIAVRLNERLKAEHGLEIDLRSLFNLSIKGAVGAARDV